MTFIWKQHSFRFSSVQYFGYFLHILSFSSSLRWAASQCTWTSVNSACTKSFCKLKLFLACLLQWLFGYNFSVTKAWQCNSASYTKILLHQNFACWKQLKFFHFVWKSASAWKSISHCKLFEVIWFYIVLCLHIKVAKRPPLTHIFALFWNTYDFLQSLRLQSGSSAFKQSNANTKCESLKEGSATSLKKGAPRRQPCSPSLISTPALNYVQTKELASFYIELMKVLCDVIKIFFDHSVMLRIA